MRRRLHDEIRWKGESTLSITRILTNICSAVILILPKDRSCILVRWLKWRVIRSQDGLLITGLSVFWHTFVCSQHITLRMQRSLDGVRFWCSGRRNTCWRVLESFTWNTMTHLGICPFRNNKMSAMKLCFVEENVLPEGPVLWDIKMRVCMCVIWCESVFLWCVNVYECMQIDECVINVSLQHLNVCRARDKAIIASAMKLCIW